MLRKGPRRETGEHARKVDGRPGPAAELDRRPREEKTASEFGVHIYHEVLRIVYSHPDQKDIFPGLFPDLELSQPTAFKRSE